MNRRQKKKAFKKKYGYNPPKETSIELSIDWNEVARAASEFGKRANIALDYFAKVVIPETVKQIQEIIETATEALKNAMENIKNMPEEDWEELKKQLSEEQKAIGESIRRGKADE